VVHENVDHAVGSSHCVDSSAELPDDGCSSHRQSHFLLEPIEEGQDGAGTHHQKTAVAGEYALGREALDVAQAEVEFVVPFDNVVEVQRVNLVLFLLQVQGFDLFEGALEAGGHFVDYFQLLGLDSEDTAALEADEGQGVVEDGYDAGDLCGLFEDGGELAPLLVSACVLGERDLALDCELADVVED
jgi:hypothetical protein